MMTASTLRRLAGLPVMGAVLFASASCGEVARSGRSPVYVIIDSIQAASGARPDAFGTILFSDVETFVAVPGQTNRVPTIFSDTARATFRTALKNTGVPTSPLGPSTINEVTLTRYRVTFLRADGRNTPGVDVPHGFDGAFTVTIPANGSATAGFDIVRHQHKEEPPLRNLRGSGGANLISAIAEITFWGRDQAGNEVMARGQLTVNFGDFGDPQ